MYSGDRTVNEMLEERRKELKRLITGALRYLGVNSYDIAMTRRRNVDVFDPDTAVFLVKADTEPALSPRDVSFLSKSLQNMNYDVKRIEHRGKRLMLFV
jgi:hypothetical protein